MQKYKDIEKLVVVLFNTAAGTINLSLFQSLPALDINFIFC